MKIEESQVSGPMLERKNGVLKEGLGVYILHKLMMVYENIMK